MTTQIERTLNSVGKACFVRYYKTFSDETLSNIDIIEVLHSENGYTEKACRTRVSKARTIIKNEWVCQALEMIISSVRLDNNIINDARAILDEFCFEKTIEDETK